MTLAKILHNFVTILSRKLCKNIWKFINEPAGVLHLTEIWTVELPHSIEHQSIMFRRAGRKFGPVQDAAVASSAGGKWGLIHRLELTDIHITFICSKGYWYVGGVGKILNYDNGLRKIFEVTILRGGSLEF